MRDKGIFLDFTPTFYDGFWSKIHETITVSPFPTLQKSGVPALDIIRSVTTSAAEMLGWQDRVGAVEPGKFADLVAVDGNPIADISQLERVRFDGQVVRNVIALH